MKTQREIDAFFGANPTLFTIFLLLGTLFPPLRTACAQIIFNRYAEGPIIPAANSNRSWHGFMSANPVAIEFHGTYFLYARGIATPGAPSTLGVWSSSKAAFNGVTWNQNPVANPILQAGASGMFDSTGIMDPSAVVFNSRIFVYYGGYAHGSNIGLAISADGLNFIKAGQVMAHAGTPFPVINRTDGKLYLFYTRKDVAGTGWEYLVATSSDGYNFGSGQLVFSPSGVAGTFDQASVITLRVLYEAPYYYMTYGGSPTCIDYPSGIGLARSADLIHWTRYARNPVLLRGPVGGWDEAALWSGSMLKVNGAYYMWYEATGSNAGAGSPASIKARDGCYGGYGKTSLSQVGLAKGAGGMSLTDWNPGEAPAPPRSSHRERRKILTAGECSIPLTR